MLSLAHYKAETKLLVIFFFFFSVLIKQSHTTQVKNKMCKTKSQMRPEDLVFALLLTAATFIHTDYGGWNVVIFLSLSHFL